MIEKEGVVEYSIIDHFSKRYYFKINLIDGSEEIIWDFYTPEHTLNYVDCEIMGIKEGEKVIITYKGLHILKFGLKEKVNE